MGIFMAPGRGDGLPFLLHDYRRPRGGGEIFTERDQTITVRTFAMVLRQSGLIDGKK